MNEKTFSIRIEPRKSGTVSASINHDFRTGRVPKYIDPARTCRNEVLLGGPPDVLSSIEEQSARIFFRTGKKVRKDANLFISGLISFSTEAKGQVANMPPRACAMQAVQFFAEKYSIKVLYIIEHNDETGLHFHFLLENISSAGESTKNKLSPMSLGNLQDEISEFFEPVGICRGKKKKDRVYDGDSMDKIIHRSVKKLHEDLPREIAAEEETLRTRITELAPDLPHLPVEEVEIVVEKGFLGDIKRKARVVGAKEVARFRQAVAGRLAASDMLLAGGAVGPEEHREILSERDDLLSERDDLRKELEKARTEIDSLKGKLNIAMGKLRELVGWLAKNATETVARFLASENAKNAPERDLSGRQNQK